MFKLMPCKNCKQKYKCGFIQMTHCELLNNYLKIKNHDKN